MIKIDLLRTFSAVEAIFPQWDDLLEKSLFDNIFLTPQWMMTWAKAYIHEEQLFFIVVYKDDRLAAIAPFWIDKKPFFPFRGLKILKFLGASDECPDHLDIIVADKDVRDTTQAIWSFLFGPLRQQWDLFEYYQIPVNSLAFAELKRIAENDSHCIAGHIRGYSPCPYIQLPGSWEAFVAGLSSNQRRALKISSERLAQPGSLNLQFCDCPDLFQQEMELLIELNSKAWIDRGGSGSFSSERSRLFHYRLAELLLKEGKLFLCSLRVGEKPIASFYGFKYKSTTYYYVMGAEKDPSGRASVGRVLLGQCIRKAIENGSKEFDMLRGDERFKYDWTDRERRELLVDFYNRKPITLAFILSEFVKFYIKQLAKSLLGSKAENGKVRKYENNQPPDDNNTSKN